MAGLTYDEEPFLRRAAALLQRRNVRSLLEGAGPGGAGLKALKDYTVKKKGNSDFGRNTGRMIAGLLDPEAVDYRIGGRTAEVVVRPGTPSTAWMVGVFENGQGAHAIEKTAKTKSGKTKKWKRTIPDVPGRPFTGIAEEDLDVMAEDLVGDFAKQMGFTEA